MFVAIEVATAGMRRGKLLAIAASQVAIVIVGGAGIGLFNATATGIHPPS